MAIVTNPLLVKEASEAGIQRSLCWRYNKDSLAPNFTPSGWWECDLLRITAAGYAYEYEVKLTLSDFKADFRKHEVRRTGEWRSMRCESKHLLMGAGDERGPNYFFFAMTPELYEKTKDLIPVHAGVWLYGSYVRDSMPKQAPKLHRTKKESWRQHAYRNMAKRYVSDKYLWRD